tara:strand:+ start:8050 stop:8214 length:165 start_codon:yes stop_codon:yes gene_type:complete
MQQTLLFMFFLGITFFGLFLVTNKSGSHDADFIMRIFGYLLLLPGIIGFLQMLP